MISLSRNHFPSNSFKRFSLSAIVQLVVVFLTKKIMDIFSENAKKYAITEFIWLDNADCQFWSKITWETCSVSLSNCTFLKDPMILVIYLHNQKIRESFFTLWQSRVDVPSIWRIILEKWVFVNNDSAWKFLVTFSLSSSRWDHESMTHFLKITQFYWPGTASLKSKSSIHET